MAKKSNIGSHWLGPVVLLSIVFIGIVIFIIVSKPYVERFSNSDQKEAVQTARGDKKSSSIIFYYFHKKGCGYCQDFNEEWEKLNKEISSNNDLKNVELRKINVAEENELSKKYDIKGVPTLILQVNSQKAIEYNGKREVKNILEFLKTKI